MAAMQRMTRLYLDNGTFDVPEYEVEKMNQEELRRWRRKGDPNERKTG